MILESALRSYRAKTFHLNLGSRLKSAQDAVDFVEERGFAFLWPVKGIDMPSLWAAVAGDRPVASAHNDPAHITWRWKDSMLSERRWYYGKLLRGKATFVSLEMIPYFYALSRRVGDLEDFQYAYEDGHLTWEARSIAQALLAQGALNKVELRSRSHFEARSAKYRFDRALTSLQEGLWVLPIGVSSAGGWGYAFIYELFDRWVPEVLTKAREITRRKAREHVAGCYLDSVGAASPKAIQKVFRWKEGDVLQALKDLNKSGRAKAEPDNRWVTRKLFEDIEEKNP
jgi:hypothetical protein